MISRLKVLILKPKIKSASEYYVVEQTYCHFSRGRSLPKSNGETGRLFFGVCLIRYRIRVEVEYFIALCELPLPELSGVEKSKFEALRALYLDFSEADALRVKEIEATTNHDVKAIEYI